MGKLVPGKYEFVVYTHECITNMDPGQSEAIGSFDARLRMSVRMLRISDPKDEAARAAVPVEIFDP